MKILVSTYCKSNHRWYWESNKKLRIFEIKVKGDHLENKKETVNEAKYWVQTMRKSRIMTASQLPEWTLKDLSNWMKNPIKDGL